MDPFVLDKKPGVCQTVEQLIKELQKLPGGLPIKQGFCDGVVPVVFNNSRCHKPHLEFEENDGTWDDD